MIDGDPAPRALAWGQARYRAGAAGKTLLAGWRGSDCLFALAAGLASAQDRERFAVLARYLLRRDEADGYWLVFPTDLEGRPHLAVETALGGGCRVAVATLGDGPQLGPTRPMGEEHQLGDLLDGGGSLPALMRRELDRLAAALAEPAP